MRRTKAKIIKQIALAATVGRPAVAYVKTRRKAIQLHPQCTRAMYRHLKRQYSKP